MTLSGNNSLFERSLATGRLTRRCVPSSASTHFPVKFPRPDDGDYRDIQDHHLRALVRAARECGPCASPSLILSTLPALSLTDDEKKQALTRFYELQAIPMDEAVSITRQGAIYALRKMRTENVFREETSVNNWTPDAIETNLALAAAPVRVLAGGETFANIEAALVAGLKQTLPTVAALDCKNHMFYAGAVNVYYGPPGGGKTLVSILAMHAAMQEGHEVLFLDFENGLKTILWRFLALGADMEMVKRKLRYVEFPTDAKFKAVQKWAADNRPGLVVVDSVAKAMGADGLNEDLAADFMKFSASRITPFLQAGSAVLMLDHTIKAAEGNGGFARGSGSKKGDVGGLMLEFVTGEPFAPKTPDRPGKAGYVRLVIRKDREGGVGPEGANFGVVKFAPGEKTRWEFTPETSDWKLTSTHQMILDAVRAGPGCTRSRVRELVREQGRSIGNDVASRMVGELIKYGHLEDRKEGKGYRLYLTEAGKEQT